MQSINLVQFLKTFIGLHFCDLYDVQCSLYAIYFIRALFVHLINLYRTDVKRRQMIEYLETFRTFWQFLDLPCLVAFESELINGL